MAKHYYRSRNEIIASILEVANGNRVRTTEIQFKVYISYNLLKEYLVLLLESNLLEYIEGERTFKTTAKGMQFLHMHNQMSEMITMNNTTRKPVNEFLLRCSKHPDLRAPEKVLNGFLNLEMLKLNAKLIKAVYQL